ncbi:hypothetical protein EDB85DRAFT_2000187 [Lactarius pseudohatsudake]|nr:hypothetical protein EDB85DRAFT_2000187 [Lactarius pseudohatsudake]
MLILFFHDRPLSDLRFCFFFESSFEYFPKGHVRQGHWKMVQLVDFWVVIVLQILSMSPLPHKSQIGRAEYFFSESALILKAGFFYLNTDYQCRIAEDLPSALSSACATWPLEVGVCMRINAHRPSPDVGIMIMASGIWYWYYYQRACMFIPSSLSASEGVACHWAPVTCSSWYM